jgi:formate-dependent nitrite reductase cytochrome c552 subunit
MRYREIVMMKRSYLSLLALLSLLLIFCGTVCAEEIVCITCHGAMPGKYGEPVKLWQGSIHAENGITCNACHGGDPKDAANAMKKERGFLGAPKYNDVPEFCGRCHVGVLKDYLASGHGRALTKGGPNCVICHGNHQIVKASLELINEKSCSRCHSYERAKLIRAAMQETETMIVAIDGRVKAYKQMGIDTDKMEKELFSTRNRFHTLFHNVDVKRVTDESTGIKGDLKKIEAAVTALDKQGSNRKKAGAIAVGLALVGALLAHLMWKTFDKH